MMTAVQNRTKESDGGERGFKDLREHRISAGHVLPDVKDILYVTAVPQRLSLQE